MSSGREHAAPVQVHYHGEHKANRASSWPEQVLLRRCTGQPQNHPTGDLLPLFNINTYTAEFFNESSIHLVILSCHSIKKEMQVKQSTSSTALMHELMAAVCGTPAC